MRASIALVLLGSLLLSGCSGAGGPKSDPSSPSLSASVTDSSTPTNTTEPNNTFVPKHHTHDYWGGRESVVLFSGTVKIGQDPAQETLVAGNDVLVGRAVFDTKSDGDDTSASDKTDVVYQGTARIDVLLQWSDASIQGIRFYYKPAGSSKLALLGPAENGKILSVPLRQGWADMPHQLSLSRWKFALEAYDPTLSSAPYRAAVARGDVKVEMTIFNGGEHFIDPPHPYFFTAGPRRYAGEVNATLTNCARVNNSAAPGAPAVGTSCRWDDYQPAAPAIVPWETTKAIVDLWYNYTGPASAAAPKLGLKFHGSDSEKYRYPKAAEETAGHVRYEFGVGEIETDSPYATQTDWRLGVFPILGDQRDAGGDFEGSFHILVTAVKEGDGGRGGI